MFITGTETPTQHLQQEIAEDIRNQVTHIFKNFKKHEPNLKRKESNKLRELREN